MSRLVLVAGSIAANYRNGGIAWERLSWILGFRRLGFQVLVVDQLDRSRCVGPPGEEPTYENCLNLGYFDAVARQFGLADSSVVLGDDGQRLYGPTLEEVLELASTSEMLVNVAGNLRIEALKKQAPRSVYVDVDPGLTQLALASGRGTARVDGHDAYFTIGEHVGTPSSPLPTGEVLWRTTRQPVLLDEWPVAPDGDIDRFTTVARWRGAGPHGDAGLGVTQKADEFLKVVELPRLVPSTFELALGFRPGEEQERALMEEHDWRIVDADGVAADPDAFRHYVQASGAEFSVAKGAYATTNSGWFSDRTTRYLASGKPALVQDTGFGAFIPAGEGLLSFRTLDDAVAGARSIRGDYVRHAAAARRIAEEYFDAEVVLNRFLEDAGT
jgi:hypothetical protein